ncbi:hypothetical protein SEA_SPARKLEGODDESS_161 [Streptomyces phage SparkleGoddess]|uniref:Uncharacterized protein n=1 Tax=Streptomyces phage SparkleGoddess TaxID=2283305 RepID=A0A345ME66_9CAUD|nr:hypothetical protein SEA_SPARKLEGODDESS_161 [Streptomyces phage SparkleGoddess]
MADWYRTHNVSPEAVSEEEYRDWLAANVSVEEADRFWYGVEDAEFLGDDDYGRTS